MTDQLPTPLPTPLAKSPGGRLARMPRVVILQEYIPAYRAPFFRGLRVAAAAAGIDLVIAAGEPGGELVRRGDAVTLDFAREVRQREWRLFGRRLVLRDVRETIAGADLVILEQARRNIDAYRLLGGRRKPGLRVALWGHGRDYTKHTGRLDRAVQGWLTSRADWFFAYTAGGVAAVTGDGFPGARTSIVQNAIDTGALRADIDGVTPQSREALSIKADLTGLTAVFLGALDDSKRLPLLIEAAGRVNLEESGFRLLIAGDGPLRGQVEGWAARYYWLTYLGPVTGPEKALALASAQVIAVPGRIGLVAVDSLAAGLPIVTTAYPLHGPEFEYLTDGVTAVVAPDSVDDYARALCDTITNAASLARLSAACRVAGEGITVDAMVANFLAGIRGALNAGTA